MKHGITYATFLRTKIDVNDSVFDILFKIKMNFQPEQDGSGHRHQAIEACVSQQYSSSRRQWHPLDDIEPTFMDLKRLNNRQKVCFQVFIER